MLLTCSTTSLGLAAFWCGSFSVFSDLGLSARMGLSALSAFSAFSSVLWSVSPRTISPRDSRREPASRFGYCSLSRSFLVFLSAFSEVWAWAAVSSPDSFLAFRDFLWRLSSAWGRGVGSADGAWIFAIRPAAPRLTAPPFTSASIAKAASAVPKLPATFACGFGANKFDNHATAWGSGLVGLGSESVVFFLMGLLSGFCQRFESDFSWSVCQFTS